jgi:hypothetical protein
MKWIEQLVKPYYPEAKRSYYIPVDEEGYYNIRIYADKTLVRHRTVKTVKRYNKYIYVKVKLPDEITMMDKLGYIPRKVIIEIEKIG